MTLTRDSAPRSDDDRSTSTSGVAPGKATRSGALPLQRKASAPAASDFTAPAAVEPGDDPFALHLPVQRQATGAAAADDPPTTTTSGGSQLPSAVQAKMESSFGADFSDVRVHEGPQASQLGAVAYAQGTDLHFAPGQYNPGTMSGDSLIGHELTHVQQQRAGRVSTPQGKGAPIVADHALEAEADRAGDRAARGEPVGESLSSASVTSGAIQRKEGNAPAVAPVAEHGPDTFGLGGYLAKLKAQTGVSADMGKYAEAKLGVTTPPIPQLGGGAIKIEGEGRYLTSKEGNELEISLHLGVTWGIDLKIFKADVQVFGEGKIKLKAKDGEMLECLGAAVKGVLYDALRGMNVRNVASLANPLAARGAEWALGSEIFDYDVFKALGVLATGSRVPQWVQDPAKQSLAAMKEFFGKHKGSFEVSIAIGVSADVGGGADGKGLAGGASAKAVHGISSGEGEEITGETRRNEFAVEAHLKRAERHMHPSACPIKWMSVSPVYPWRELCEPSACRPFHQLLPFPQHLWNGAQWSFQNCVGGSFGSGRAQRPSTATGHSDRAQRQGTAPICVAVSSLLANGTMFGIGYGSEARGDNETLLTIEEDPAKAKMWMNHRNIRDMAASFMDGCKQLYSRFKNLPGEVMVSFGVKNAYGLNMHDSYKGKKSNAPYIDPEFRIDQVLDGQDILANRIETLDASLNDIIFAFNAHATIR